jgi:4-hydroxybenzoate polyprenyltransferase
MKRLLLRLGDYVFVMRPLILVPAWSFYLLGAAAGQRMSGVTPRPADLAPDAPAQFYIGLGCLTAILITAYLLNQVFDQETDRINDKGHFLTRGIFSVRTVVLMALVTFLIATYCFRFVDDAQRLPLVIAVVLSLAYSLPPLRLVARPFADLLSNAIGYGGVAYVAGFAAWHPPAPDAYLLALPYVFLVGATFLHTTIMDVEGDKRSGKITTSVVIGTAPSAALAWALSAAGLVPALAVSFARFGDKLAPVILAAGTAIFVHAALKLRKSRKDPVSSNAVQWATVLITIPAVVAWPAYLLLMIPLVVAARLYYRARFGVNYPGPAVSARRQTGA